MVGKELLLALLGSSSPQRLSDKSLSNPKGWGQMPLGGQGRGSLWVSAARPERW